VFTARYGLGLKKAVCAEEEQQQFNPYPANVEYRVSS
jgi:hypothetical protein